MSTLTISDLHYIRREQLASLLSSPDTTSKIAVIDVRDSDHVGGHIRSSLWVPINTLDYRVAELIRTLKTKEKVVFHCALSQQRGPSAALRYARERARMFGKEEDGKEGKKQEVCVLEGGFMMWQSKYGKDEKLTEGYVKDLWDD
jgi:rhodanese-related sulfurtransferase